MQQTIEALQNFTARYLQHWQQNHQSLPASDALYGLPSPCIKETTEDKVYWRPQPFIGHEGLNAVARGIDLLIQPSVCAFYTTQLAGDMHARLADKPVCLLQVWNDDDYQRLQQNLLGHLVMKRRFKQPPTLFIGTTDQADEMISVDNLTGQVILERPTRRPHQQVLAPNIAEFLSVLSF